jgi:hypothetical protein
LLFLFHLLAFSALSSESHRKGIKSCRILQLFYTFLGATHLIYADTEVLSRRPEGKVVAIPPLLPSALSHHTSALSHQPSYISHQLSQYLSLWHLNI